LFSLIDKIDVRDREKMIIKRINFLPFLLLSVRSLRKCRNLFMLTTQEEENVMRVKRKIGFNNRFLSIAQLLFLQQQSKIFIRNEKK
jgi:hypothetical protein